MMNKIKYIFISLCLFSVTMNAQDMWTLDACIEYALNNNIEIKQKALETQLQENYLQQSKNDRLPNLNAGVSQSFGFGRSLDINNSYVSTASSNTGFSVGTDVDIWKGGEKRKTIEKRELDFKASLHDLAKAKSDMSLSVTQAFLEILMAKELMNVADEQVKMIDLQILRAEKLVDAGKLAKGEVLELQAQKSRDYLEFVNAENNHFMALLSMSQLLELDNHAEFEIVEPPLPDLQAELSLLSAKAVYETALNERPEIKLAEYRLESSAKQVDIAKTARLPSLSASANFYDQYYTTTGSDYNVGFSQQMQDNSRSSVGLSLQIPIFNRYAVKTSVSNAVISQEQYELNLESTKKELRRQIEQAYFNAMGSYESYRANKVAVASMEEAFRYTTKKFDLGRVNSVEYNDTKTRLSTAKSNLLQSKYEFVFRTKILDFYGGLPLEL